MKPGSSQRCKVRSETVRGHTVLRCRRHAGHVGPHEAPRGANTERWFVGVTPEPVR